MNKMNKLETLVKMNRKIVRHKLKAANPTITVVCGVLRFNEDGGEGNGTCCSTARRMPFSVKMNKLEETLVKMNRKIVRHKLETLVGKIVNISLPIEAATVTAVCGVLRFNEDGGEGNGTFSVTVDNLSFSFDESAVFAVLTVRRCPTFDQIAAAQ
jgi:hypothetical protein